jgi:hypothetical protein
MKKNPGVGTCVNDFCLTKLAIRMRYREQLKNMVDNLTFPANPERRKKKTNRLVESEKVQRTLVMAKERWGK